jgi:uncharacterized protein DUF7010
VDPDLGSCGSITAKVTIVDAQRDVRTVFLGGFAGQLVSSGVWFLSAASATWYSPKTAMEVLVVAGFFIFPMTQLLLRLMGRPAGLPKGHPMNALGMQVAFVLPLCLPLAFASTAYRQNWFYPAVMIALGAHYLPFIFMYGMWQFGVLAAFLIGSGVVIGLYLPSIFSLGGWLTALALLVFAFVGRSVARTQAPRAVVEG